MLIALLMMRSKEEENAPPVKKHYVIEISFDEVSYSTFNVEKKL